MNETDGRAHEAIRNTLATYNWCGDNADYEGYLATFALNGVLDLKGVGTYEGREAIRAGILQAFGASPAQLERRRQAGGRFSHHVSSIRIELTSPTEARCWSYFAVAGPSGWDHWGRYTDRLTLLEGRWLFTYRRVSVDGHSPNAVMYAPDSQ